MKSQRRVKQHAFTLIELLTVIAIIAILAAIIFPVFSAVRENARRTSCMTNMMQISSGLKQYELDNRKYPDFLFAPALKSDGAGSCLLVNGKPVVAGAGEVACTPEQAAATGKLGGDFVNGAGTVVASGGLYPEYVKSMNTYLCPNNSWYLPTGDKQFSKGPTDADYPVTNPMSYYDAQTIDKATTSTLSDKYGDAGSPAALRFYKFDSYDSSPTIRKDASGAAIEKINAATNGWTTRYQRQWLPAVTDPNPPAGTYPYMSDRQKQLYQNQLMWKNPSDDSVVTMCTFHAEKGKVIVLTLGGGAKVLDNRRLKEQATPDGYSTSGDFDTYKMTPQ